MARKSHRKKRYHTRRSNLSFTFSMILLGTFLVFLAFASINPVKAPEAAKTANTNLATVELSETIHEETTIPEEMQVPTEASVALELHQIDVGCANAYLIRYDGYTIFIDGGQSFAYKTVSNYLDNIGVIYLDAYIATHWHGDHADNMSKILDKYAHQATVVFGPSASPNSEYPVSQGMYMQMVNGDSFQYGDLTLTCLGPYKVKEDGNSNPDSLNILFQYKDFKALITGDYLYDKVIEEYSELTANVDVLQMPHHGLDPLCISKAALQHCNPSLILVPANSSSHTNKVVREENLDATVLNNQSGCIAVVTYGNGYTVYTGVIASDFEY